MLHHSFYKSPWSRRFQRKSISI